MKRIKRKQALRKIARIHSMYDGPYSSPYPKKPPKKKKKDKKK